MNRRRLSTALTAAAVVVGLAGVTPALASGQGGPATVIGTVTFQGEPVKGAAVTLKPDVEDGGDYAVTNDDGVFVMEDATRGWRWFTAEAEGFIETYAPGVARQPEAELFRVKKGTTTVNIELIKGATVRGRVIDENGAPVPGAGVSGANLTRTGDDGTETDASGEYVLHKLATGPVTIEASRWTEEKNEQVAGEGRITLDVRMGETVTAPDIVLKSVPQTKSGKFTGKVSRLTSDDSIYLYNTKTKETVYLKSAYKKKVKVKGKAEPGTYRLLLGGLNHASKKFTIKPGKTVKTPKFKGPKGKRGKVTGTVKTAKGKPLKGAWVHLEDSYGTGLDTSDETNAKGKFAIQGVGKGRYTIEAYKWPHKHATKSKKLTVKKRGATVKKSLKLGKSYTVRGTVTSNGEPVAGLAIYHYPVGHDTTSRAALARPLVGAPADDGWDPDAWTNEKGEFTVKYVPRGKRKFMVIDHDTGGYIDVTKVLTVKKNTRWNPVVVR